MIIINFVIFTFLNINVIIFYYPISNIYLKNFCFMMIKTKTIVHYESRLNKSSDLKSVSNISCGHLCPYFELIKVNYCYVRVNIFRNTAVWILSKAVIT